MTTDVKEDVGSENGFSKEENEILDEKKLELKSSLSLKPDKTVIETKSSTEILTELFSAFNAEPPVIEEVCGDGDKTVKITKKSIGSRRSSDSGEEDSAGDKVKEKKGEKKKKEKKKKHKHKSSKHRHSSKKDSDSSGINRLHRSREKDKDDIATYSKIKEKILKASASKSKSCEQLAVLSKEDSSQQFRDKCEFAGISSNISQNITISEGITEATHSSHCQHDNSRNCLHDSSMQNDLTCRDTLEGKDNLDISGSLLSITSSDDVVSVIEVGVIPLPEDCAIQEIHSSAIVKQNDNSKVKLKEEINDGIEVMQISSQNRTEEFSLKSERVVKKDGKSNQLKDGESYSCDKVESMNILVHEKIEASSAQLIAKQPEQAMPTSSDVSIVEKFDNMANERMEQSINEKTESGKNLKSSISISDNKAKSKIKIKNLKFSTVFQQTLKEAEEQARKKEEEQVNHNSECENLTTPSESSESKPKANETQNGDATDQDHIDDHYVANEFKSVEDISAPSVHEAKEPRDDKEKGVDEPESKEEDVFWSAKLENGDKQCSKKERDTSEDEEEPRKDKAEKINEAIGRKGSESRSTCKSKAKEKKKRRRSRSKSREKSKKRKRSKSPGKTKSRSRSSSLSKNKKRKRSRSRSESKSKRKKRSRSRSKGGKSSGSKASKKSRSKHRKKSRSKSKERKNSQSRSASICKDVKKSRSLSKERKSEGKKRKSESKERKSESKERKSEIKERKCESKDRKSESKERKSEIKERKSEIKERKSESKDRKSESKERKSESKERKSVSKDRKSVSKERKSRSKSKGRNRSHSKDYIRNESRDRGRSKSRERSRSVSKETKRSYSKEKKRSISKERRIRSKDGKRSSSRKHSKRRSRSCSRKSRSHSRRKSRSRSRKRSASRKKSRSESRKRSRSRKKSRSRSRKKSRSISRSRRSRSHSKKRSGSRGRKRSHSRSRRKSRSESRKESNSRNRRRSRSRSYRKSRSQSRQSRCRSERKSRSRSRRSGSRRSRSRKRSQSLTKCWRSRSDRESRKRSSSRKRSRKSRSRSKKRSRSQSKIRSKSDERRSGSRSRKRSRGSTHDKEKDSRRSKTVEKSKLAAAGGSESTGPSSITSGDGGKSGEGDEEKLDKARLLEIARKNAVNLLQQGSLPPSVVGKDQKGKLLTLKAGGKSVEELTEYCKELSRKEAMGESSDSDGEGGSGSGSHVAPVIHHPFQIKERPTPGMIGIGIRSSLPPANAIMDKPSDQSKLRMQFPVSSGQEHRKTESDSPLAICYHEEADTVEDADSVSGDVPEEKEKIIIDPKDQVFPDYSNCENMDIGSIVSQRLTALRKLQENPDDLDALNEMTQAQKDMQVWAESKSQPGLFTGSTGAKVLSAAELASGSQAWARKDQLKCATPLTGGMGMLLLQKMGWRPGEGLGKNKEGVLEPLKLDVKTDKRGLVSQEELHRHTNVHRRGHVARSHPRHSFGKHPVSVLVEICSKRRWKVPHFQLVFESGPDHKKSFLFKAIVNGVEYQPPAPSPNKKQAKAHAASICLQAIGVYPPSMNYEGACI